MASWVVKRYKERDMVNARMCVPRVSICDSSYSKSFINVRQVIAVKCTITKCDLWIDFLPRWFCAARWVLSSSTHANFRPWSILREKNSINFVKKNTKFPLDFRALNLKNSYSLCREFSILKDMLFGGYGYRWNYLRLHVLFAATLDMIMQYCM